METEAGRGMAVSANEEPMLRWEGEMAAEPDQTHTTESDTD